MAGLEQRATSIDPFLVAAQLESAYVQVLHDRSLPQDHRLEIARRTQEALIDHMEQHPELQNRQPSDAFTMTF